MHWYFFDLSRDPDDFDESWWSPFLLLCCFAAAYSATMSEKPSCGLPPYCSRIVCSYLAAMWCESSACTRFEFVWVECHFDAIGTRGQFEGLGKRGKVVQMHRAHYFLAVAVGLLFRDRSEQSWILVAKREKNMRGLVMHQ